MSLWHYAIGEDVHGPIPLDDLRTLIRTRGTSEDVFVWRGGMPDWLPASEVPELIRQVQGTESASTNISAASTPRTQTAAAPPSGLTGFFKRLAQYYAEFLSTDFKKQRLPRRRLQNADAQGRLVGIPLRKYPGFQQKLWVELAKPVGSGLSLSIARGSWRSTLQGCDRSDRDAYSDGETGGSGCRRNDSNGEGSEGGRTQERRPGYSVREVHRSGPFHSCQKRHWPSAGPNGRLFRTHGAQADRVLEGPRRISFRCGSSAVSRVRPAPHFQSCWSSTNLARSKPFYATI